jgi:uncharacterized low-complexity protein
MVSKKTALSLAIGSAFATSMALAPVASAADNPFEMDSLKDGYQIVADKKADSAEGKCGEGKCGGDKVTDAKATKGNANRTRTSGR